MLKADLRDDVCKSCGTSLGDAVSIERREVVWTAGEFAGDPGIALEVVCHCGAVSTIPWVAHSRPRA